jgi:translation initiation factor 3 subunit E
MFSSSLQNVIEINRPPLPVYQTVIEKTRQLAVRTQALGVAVTRAAQPATTVPSVPRLDAREQVLAVN